MSVFLRLSTLQGSGGNSSGFIKWRKLKLWADSSGWSCWRNEKATDREARAQGPDGRREKGEERGSPSPRGLPGTLLAQGRAQQGRERPSSLRRGLTLPDPLAGSLAGLCRSSPVRPGCRCDCVLPHTAGAGVAPCYASVSFIGQVTCLSWCLVLLPCMKEKP